MDSQNQNPFLCLTFSSYTSDGLVEIAAKVSDDYKKLIDEEDNNDDLFEFALLKEEADSLIFPVFNQNEAEKNIENLDDSVILVPLKTLFMQEERENRISTSSDESESEAPEPKPSCMWRRKSIVPASSPSGCKKSKSTGSVLFKRFKIYDFLKRSYSDGKDSNYAFAAKIDNDKSLGRVAGKVKSAAGVLSAHELFYVQKRSVKEGDKRKSYLPYRKDLIGFFSVLGRASRT